MKLYIIRHAIAEDRDVFAKLQSDDTLRPLTLKGQKKFEKMAKFLHEKIENIDYLIASPYKRAFETADILHKYFQSSEFRMDNRMVPEANIKESLKMLGELKMHNSIAIVGHEPHLGLLISFLLAGSDYNFVEVKKGSVCCIEFKGDPAPHRGQLKWYITPGFIG